ncbi:MAG TPA: FAD-binding protein, partial [Ilumatobacteraceae bacterium]|nr:FAD-binding protein [Ilumatobacteraceae bacterium]
MTTTPTPPIELTGSGQRLTGDVTPIRQSLLDRLSAICETITNAEPVAEASRDWWPLALHWSLAGMVPRLAGAVVRPTTTSEVAAVLAACDEARIPVTAAGGRSGVSGASVPIHGGVVL